MTVNAFHTSSDEDRPVWHDQSECHAGKEIKNDGNAVAGKNGDYCKICKALKK